MAIWSQDTKNVKKSAYVVEWIRSLILIKRREKHLLPIKSICDIVGGRPLQYLQGGMYRAVEKYHAFHRLKYHSILLHMLFATGVLKLMMMNKSMLRINPFSSTTKLTSNVYWYGLKRGYFTQNKMDDGLPKMVHQSDYQPAINFYDDSSIPSTSSTEHWTLQQKP